MSKISPLVSVIIPTYKRPDYLPRAVQSALSGMEHGEVEVLVIPNGGDASWKYSLRNFADNSFVKVYESVSPNQNIARNIGLKMAEGQLIRFLDDDDYLLPQASQNQYRFMQQADLDFCSGHAEIRDRDNSLIAQLSQPDERTPCAASISRKRLQLPFTHVYRRSSLKDIQWPVDLLQSEDIVWLIRYATKAPRRWRRFDQVVGVWYQHAAARQSLDRPSGFVHEATARALLEARTTLAQQGRWNENLAHLTAEALWDLVHRAFPFRPLYWSGIASQALQMEHTARPVQPVYSYPGLRHLDPRILLWLLLPKRWATLSWINGRSLFKGHDYRRTL